MLLTARAASLLAGTSLFLLQPLVARALVPLYGGTSWVWIAVSVFFQLSLIAGYAAATKLGESARVRWHARVAIAAMVLAIAGFWMLFEQVTFEGLRIEAAVFVHLFVTVGAAALYLAMAQPLLQKSIEADGRIDAHRLYAWSNAGSLAGLILYPTVMDTFVPLRYQMATWLALAASAAFMIHRTVAHSEANIAPQPIQWRFPGRGRVMFTSAAAGALTIAVTTRLTLDLGALPLLWVLPLIVLLLSYIVAFGEVRGQRSLSAAAPTALAIAAYFLFSKGTQMPPLEMVILWCGLLFVVQCGLQTRIRALAPSGGARGAFYVALAVGGFTGSLLVGCVIPYSWNTAELMTTLPLAGPVLRPLLGNDPIPELGWCLIAAAFVLMHQERWRTRDLILAAVASGTALLLITSESESSTAFRALTVVALLIGSMALAYLPAIAGRPRLFAIGMTAVVIANSYVQKLEGNELFRTRTVYGVLTALETPNRAFTALFHGTTLHGMQRSSRNPLGEVLPIAPQHPLTYFHTASPIGELFRQMDKIGCPLRVGIVGLGAGTLAAYARSGDDFEFYEIDPGVVEAAEGRHFSYLASARQRGARVSVIVGDGRRTLAKRVGPKLDLLVMDAFSSDSIPTHLLTLEAFHTASRQLAAGGQIAFHTSSRYFSVDSVVSANADRLGWRHSMKLGGLNGVNTAVSQWVLVQPEPDPPATSGCIMKMPLETTEAAAARTVWTDDFSNPLAVVKAQGLWRQLTIQRPEQRLPDPPPSPGQ